MQQMPQISKMQIFQVEENPHALDATKIWKLSSKNKWEMTPYRTPQEKSNPLLMVGLMKFLQTLFHKNS